MFCVCPSLQIFTISKFYFFESFIQRQFNYLCNNLIITFKLCQSGSSIVFTLFLHQPFFWNVILPCSHRNSITIHLRFSYLFFRHAWYTASTFIHYFLYLTLFCYMDNISNRNYFQLNPVPVVSHILTFVSLSSRNYCFDLLLFCLFGCFLSLFLFCFPSLHINGLQSTSLGHNQHGYRNHLFASWYLGSQSLLPFDMFLKLLMAYISISFIVYFRRISVVPVNLS